MNMLLHDPTFWVAVSFGIFVILFARYAVPPIVKALDNRSARIKEELDEAVRLREEAQTVLSAYQKKQKAISKEAEELLAKAKQEAEAMTVQAEAELKKALDRRIEQAKQNIERTENRALQEVQDNIVDIAVNAARVIIVDHLDSNDDEALIELALKDINRIVH